MGKNRGCGLTVKIQPLKNGLEVGGNGPNKQNRLNYYIMGDQDDSKSIPQKMEAKVVSKESAKRRGETNWKLKAQEHT